jgi:hypothetical protein
MDGAIGAGAPTRRNGSSASSGACRENGRLDFSAGEEITVLRGLSFDPSVTTNGDAMAPPPRGVRNVDSVRAEQASRAIANARSAPGAA